jgi:hypothetical protein
VTTLTACGKKTRSFTLCGSFSHPVSSSFESKHVILPPAQSSQTSSIYLPLILTNKSQLNFIYRENCSIWRQEKLPNLSALNFPQSTGLSAALYLRTNVGQSTQQPLITKCVKHRVGTLHRQAEEPGGRRLRLGRYGVRFPALTFLPEVDTGCGIASASYSVGKSIPLQAWKALGAPGG